MLGLALEEIKNSLEEDTRNEAAKYRKASSEEEQRILDHAEKSAGEIILASRKKAEAEAERIRREGIESFGIEGQGIVARAAEDAIMRESKRAKSEIEKEIGRKHMERLLENAVSSFLPVATKQELVITGSRKYEHYAKKKGYAFENGDMEGFVIRTRDKRVSLNATVSKIVENNSDMIKSVVSGEMFPDRKGKEESQKKKHGVNAEKKKKRVKMAKAKRRK